MPKPRKSALSLDDVQALLDDHIEFVALAAGTWSSDDPFKLARQISGDLIDREVILDDIIARAHAIPLSEAAALHVIAKALRFGEIANATFAAHPPELLAAMLRSALCPYPNTSVAS